MPQTITITAADFPNKINSGKIIEEVANRFPEVEVDLSNVSGSTITNPDNVTFVTVPPSITFKNVPDNITETQVKNFLKNLSFQRDDEEEQVVGAVPRVEKILAQSPTITDILNRLAVLESG